MCNDIVTCSLLQVTLCKVPEQWTSTANIMRTANDNKGIPFMVRFLENYIINMDEPSSVQLFMFLLYPCSTHAMQVNKWLSKKKPPF